LIAFIYLPFNFVSMQLDITLSLVQLIDLLFRFQAVGILCLIGFMTIKFTPQILSNVALASCLAAYILLTAPIENHIYGWTRPLLLLLTDLTAYSLFAVYWQKVHKKSFFLSLSMLFRVVLCIWLAWLTLFFFVYQGRGIFHDINHVIGMFILFYIVVDALRDYKEDLDESRRGFRLQTIIIIGVYSLCLTLVEIFFYSIKDHWLFSVINALLMFVLTAFFALRFIESHSATQTNIVDKQNISPHSLNPKVEKLMQLMQPEFFCQSELTVSKMAEAMALPDHQLRKLINVEMGFDNFSKFLNSYRIPLVCEKLIQQDRSIPILTHALNAGFNSIASFNRAFKEFTGVTPSEYRKSHS